jgi:hypothetical protein
MDNEMFEALARKTNEQYMPAPGEAAMGIGLIAAVIGRLMNESDKYELREENVKLKAQLEAQQQAQLAALMQQNQQLMLMLQQRDAEAPRQADTGVDLADVLEALLRAATPAQAEQVRRVLADNPQAAARLRLPAPATSRNGGR